MIAFPLAVAGQLHPQLVRLARKELRGKQRLPVDAIAQRRTRQELPRTGWQRYPASPSVERESPSAAVRAFRMATGGYAGHGTVRVARLSLVNGIRAGHAVRGLRVAINAGLRRVIRGVHVAIRANRAVMGKLPIGMAERRAEPACCGVAGGARCGKSRSNVIWHATAKRLRALPSRGVAAVTVRR